MSRPVVRRILKVLALVLIGVIVGVPTALSTFEHSSRDVVIGAHDATVQPTFDGFATLDFGPVLPRMRVASDQPFGLGVAIDLGDSQVSNLDQLTAQDALIASQPQGEIAKISSTIVGMAEAAALRGLGAGVLAVIGVILAWRAVGSDRRAAIRSRAVAPTRRQVISSVAVGATALASVGLLAVPEISRSPAEMNTWTKLKFVVPDLPRDKVLDKVEVSQGAASRTGQALLESAVTTYRASVAFYGKLAETARTVAVRQPEEGEKTALVVTDRHDNIGMDKATRAVADQAKAKMLIDLGDDTSNGGNWEDFSINSLAKAFKGFTVVAVAGNHDTGPFIRKTMSKAGFHVLADKAETIDGIRFLGSSDPRASGLTAGYSGNESDTITAIRQQDDRLEAEACKAGDVSVVLAHSPSGSKKTAASGCADLVLNGHLHRQVGPSVITGANGRRTETLTTGTTGGAVFAFALGSKLRRPAQVTIVTFKDGRPVGLQPVDFATGGEVTAQAFTPITVSPR